MWPKPLAWINENREQELADLIRRGDACAFEEFAHQFGPRLLHFSMFVCRQREDAEEVVQDTLLRLHDNIGQLRESEKLRPWAYRIAKNVCLMKRRKSVHAPAREYYLSELSAKGVEIPDASGSPNASFEFEDLTEKLQDAILGLPEDFRMVFLLRQVEGLSTTETAYALDTSLDVVKTRLKRARAAIRTSLDGGT